MEDAHFAVSSLEGPWADTAAFGVLDGHGGCEVAFFCERRLPKAIASNARSVPSEALALAIGSMDELLTKEIEYLRSFTGQWREQPLDGASRVGCTAAVCLVQADFIFVANVGDSRTVLARDNKAIALSEDHKPDLPKERERIHRAGGTVLEQQVGDLRTFRVNGNLNVSRSIGDLYYKNDPLLAPEDQLITSSPDIIEYQRSPKDQFLLIASDGVWDQISNQAAVDFVLRQLGRKPSDILEDLLNQCFAPDLSKTGGLGGDNMTAVLVLLNSEDNVSPSSLGSSPGVGVRMKKLPPLVEEACAASGLGCTFLPALCSVHTRCSL